MKTYQSLADLQYDLFSGEFSCTEVVNRHLKLIESNSDLNAFLEVYPLESIETAADLDAKIVAGSQGQLAGLCIGVKDLLNHEGHKRPCFKQDS